MDKLSCKIVLNIKLACATNPIEYMDVSITKKCNKRSRGETEHLNLDSEPGNVCHIIQLLTYVEVDIECY